MALLIVTLLIALVGCSSATPPPTTESESTAVQPPAPQPDPLHRPLAADPVRLADDLVADEEVLRDPAAPEHVLAAAAQRQQAAYRVLGHHPEWDPITRPRIPEHLLAAYDRNVDARRELNAMSKGYANDKLPAWRIVAPPAADELLGYYRKAEAEHGVGWSYLAAINLVETAFGRVDGVSTAGAQGPMQFLPSTFALYGAGGDIRSFHDSIMAAGRYLAASGFARDRDRALWRYNNSMQYVRAVSRYAEVLEADPAAFDGYYRWDVYYNSTAGDVLLPVGYAATAPIPVDAYLQANPKALAHRPR
ncbi:lytic transglycosylase domain-containing protein [Mycolicibacterium thermoresistibile]